VSKGPSRLLTWLSLSSVLALLAVGALSAPAGAQTTPSTPSDCPSLSLGNPHPGDLLSAGGYVVTGAAYVPSFLNGLSGSGISHVDFFLGARDAGGTLLGRAYPGTASSPREFSIEVTLPSIDRGADFVAYAYSAASNAVTTVSVPVHIGARPTPGPEAAGATPTPTPQAIITCVGASQTGAPAAPMAQPGQATPVPGLSQPSILAGSSQGPVLSLGNPAANDVLAHGAYSVTGLAYDPAATSGSGISQVSFFIGNRDAGGIALGSVEVGAPGVFRAQVTIPDSIAGGHDFYAYAQSSVTGRETAVSVPVFIGAAPTPTPRP